MDKKLITAIVLAAAVLLGYPYLLKQLFPPKPEPLRVSSSAESREGAPAVSKGKAGAEARLKEAAALAAEELTTIETPLYKAVFSSNGGGVKSWELKKYKETRQQDSKNVNLAETIVKDLSLKTRIGNDGGFQTIALKPSKKEIVISSKEIAELIYEGGAKGGIRVEKRYVFTGGSYSVATGIRVQNSGGAHFKGKAETVLFSGAAGKDTTGFHAGPIVQTSDKLLRQDVKDPHRSGSGTVKWMGLEDKYFLAALIPKTDTGINWITEAPSAEPSRAALQIPLELAPGELVKYGYDAFIGPKEYDTLLQYKTGLEEAIEFGYFSFMAKPTLVVLNFFQRYVINYGIAIVFLTVIIKVIFYPLTHYSLKSMKEMQNIQPQLLAIKEKFKDNKEKLNKEMMELYKRYKINPLGGCLPMVLQIPVFIALYEVLYVAIELRHAPLFLWIKDLSDKDPYYVTPLIMGATMFIQQKMTPTTADPAQAKIMLIMPVVFTFMFLKFPSGLVVYWLINNVLSIAQQYYVQKKGATA
ncbi:MAG: membrane protein insertase YidC [Deltaproteobacteria bacterium]|nr:membrane protein insertase YidC [Deltaproteobacteria bacterium]